MTTIKSAGALVIDVSTQNLGRFRARSKQEGKQKLRVTKGVRSYDYDIGIKQITVPFQMGDGLYTVALYKNVSGNKYVGAGALKVSVTLANEFVPYLWWNCYVDYQNSKDLMAYTRGICQGLTGAEAVSAIKRELKNKYSYDYVKSVMVKKGEMPDIDRCFYKKMGICQDLAALAVAMFRIKGVPAKLVIGTASGIKHAWCEVYYGGKWNLYDPSVQVEKTKKQKRYVKERWY